MSEDDYADAREDLDDDEDFQDHQEHEIAVEGCTFCEGEEEQRRSEILEGLIALFVMEPCDQDREAARRSL